MRILEKAVRAAIAIIGLAAATTAGAQGYTAFPRQNPNGPTGNAYQTNYPYPGQCTLNSALFPELPLCSAKANSFNCDANLGAQANGSNRTAGGWAACGVAPPPFVPLAPIVPNGAVAAPAGTPRFAWEMLNPPDYTPTAAYTGADYYELILHEAWGAQTLGDLDLFPDPLIGTCSVGGAYCDTAKPCPSGTCNPVYPNATPIPNGMQWTGLTCNNPAGCACPADAASPFKDTYCNVGATTFPLSPAGKIPYGYPLYTPIWGVGSRLNGVPLLNQPGSSWSANDFVATWPSINIRANKGTPVVVKWVNEFPNTHVLCPYPDVADYPCSIDRTFMGVKSTIDPAVASSLTGVAPDGVNPYGSPQQPDNSWVTHLHGGEIPPSTDGFAELWFGNRNTARLYNDAAKPRYVMPAFENPSGLHLVRPSGSDATYTYPMVQEEATIWFHDHTLGKTHHNVIAGPAGFFPVKEPAKHAAVAIWTPPAPGVTGTAPPLALNQEYTWVDPVTEPRTTATALALKVPTYDLFMAVQDRAFNEDGSINFSNGLGQTLPPALGTPECAAAIAADPLFVCSAAGTTPITPGVNPLVHPTWVPEYFGDHALVNGVIWPKKSLEPGWYRMRLVNGSDSRCYTFGFQVGAMPTPGAAVSFQVPFFIIASDQGYYKVPVKAVQNRVTMCPGERYELLVNFGALPTVAVNTTTFQPNPATVWLVNNAPAPFPAGISPQQGSAPELNVIMRFDVNAAFGPGIKSCGASVKVGKVTTPIAPVGLTVGTATGAWDPPSPTNPNSNLTTSAGGAPPPGGTPLIPAGFYDKICMPANPAQLTPLAAPDYVDLRAGAGVTFPTATPWGPPTFAQGTIVRQVYLNEKVDGTTAAPLGMQLNGVPFEYKVTETPKFGTTEVWQFINLTVDAHPMHPHLVRHQILARQKFNSGSYKRALCGSTTCQPGPAPGNEMQVVPDVNLTTAPGPFGLGAVTLVNDLSNDGGYKDATRVMPGEVTTIVAEWKPRWTGAGAGTLANPAGTANAPGSSGCPAGGTGCGGSGAAWTYEAVTAGPYVWHCHINSHEDSEMMRTSLVVP